MVLIIAITTKESLNKKVNFMKRLKLMEKNLPMYIMASKKDTKEMVSQIVEKNIITEKKKAHGKLIMPTETQEKQKLFKTIYKQANQLLMMKMVVKFTTAATKL